jgi:UDP-glucose:(heptosyl)LPS alpha-1,3-glucosyltransferase
MVTISMPIDVWRPGRGGAEACMEALARDLARRGHAVTVLCLEANGEAAPAAGMRVERLSVPRWPRWRREICFARAALRAHEESGRDLLLAARHALRADVYHPHGGCFRASREALQRSAAPLERLWRRLSIPFRPALQVLLRLDREVFLASPDLVTVSASRVVEEDFRRSYPELRYRFELLPNGVDLERFHDRDRADARAWLCARFRHAPAEKTAVFAAHSFRLKGLAHALGAVARAPGWQLVVAGRGRTGPYRRRAAALGIEARVRFAGPVDDPRRLYAGADALLLPTYYDPCSLATLEAAACGTPVVTTRANGAAELLEPAGAALVVASSGDEQALAEALLEAGRRWGELHEGALGARASLSWSRYAERMEAILVEAARSRRAAALPPTAPPPLPRAGGPP